MALFFNQDWFAARMRAHHLTPDTVARALGLSAAQWRAVTRDQRELRPREVQALAQLLGASRRRCTEAGIAPRAPPLPPPWTRFRALEQRVAALERAQSASSASAPKRPGRRTRR